MGLSPFFEALRVVFLFLATISTVTVAKEVNEFELVARPVDYTDFTGQSLDLSESRTVLLAAKNGRDLVRLGEPGQAVSLVHKAILEKPDRLAKTEVGWVSSHRLARDFIRTVPSTSLNFYYSSKDGIYSGAARNLLNEAAKAHDFEKMAQVANTFAFTEAGQEATYLLAYAHFRLGKMVQAAKWFDRLMEDPNSSLMAEGGVLALGSFIYTEVGDRTSLERVLSELERRNISSLELGGRKSKTQRLASYLRRQIGNADPLVKQCREAGLPGGVFVTAKTTYINSAVALGNGTISAGDVHHESGSWEYRFNVLEEREGNFVSTSRNRETSTYRRPIALGGSSFLLPMGNHVHLLSWDDCEGVQLADETGKLSEDGEEIGEIVPLSEERFVVASTKGRFQWMAIQDGKLKSEAAARLDGRSSILLNYSDGSLVVVTDSQLFWWMTREKEGIKIRGPYKDSDFHLHSAHALEDGKHSVAAIGLNNKGEYVLRWVRPKDDSSELVSEITFEQSLMPTAEPIVMDKTLLVVPMYRQELELYRFNKDGIELAGTHELGMTPNGQLFTTLDRMLLVPSLGRIDVLVLRRPSTLVKVGEYSEILVSTSDGFYDSSRHRLLFTVSGGILMLNLPPLEPENPRLIPLNPPLEPDPGLKASNRVTDR